MVEHGVMTAPTKLNCRFIPGWLEAMVQSGDLPTCDSSSGSSRSETPIHDDQYCFPETRFVRLASILAQRGAIPVGKTTWWAGVKSGRFPQPVKLGPRLTVWRAEDIRNLFERKGAKDARTGTSPEGIPLESVRRGRCSHG
jgi:predicted DNA-binding transcriptional regulator AlpA